MYIEMGLARLPAAAKPALLPLMLSKLSARPEAQRTTLCRPALDVAAHFALPAEPAAAEVLCQALAAQVSLLP